MTRVVGVWLGLGLLGAAAAAQAGPALKIGYINGTQVLQQTPGYTAAESTFDRAVQGYRGEVQKLAAQLDSAVRAFDQQSIALSPAAKQAKQKQLQTMQQHLTDRQNELQQQAQTRQQELMQPIYARIKAVIQGLRAEGNYALIVDADSPGIMAADPSLDLTSKVLQRLKQSQ